MDGGAWWAAVHGVAQSRTRLNALAAAAAVKLGNSLTCDSWIPLTKELNEVVLPALIPQQAWETGLCCGQAFLFQS